MALNPHSTPPETAEATRARAPALLEGQRSGLLRFVRRHAGQAVLARESSEDIVQSACREVLQNLDAFQYGGEDEFRRWLYATARRKILMRRRFHAAARRSAGRERFPGPEASSPSLPASWHPVVEGPGPDMRLAIREEIEEVAEACRRLPPEYREVLRLARIEGLSRADVAARMGRTEAAVRMLLCRATARLAATVGARNLPT